jgi:hypothetical protein
MMKNNMENTEHTKYTRVMLFILAIVLLVASVVGYFVSRNMGSSGGASTTNYALRPTNSPLPTPSLIPYPIKGSLVLKEPVGQEAKVGIPFTLDVIATSSKDTVAGYDVVLSYDKASLENQTIQNKYDSFRIFSYKRPDHLAISATKNLSVVEQVRFTDTPILSLTFIAKQKGTYTFSLKPVGNESSKFVNEAAAVTYPTTSDIRLEIK